MKTIRFYAKEKYMGYQKVENTTLREIRSWIRSGNYIKMGDKIYNDPEHNDFNILK